MSPLLDQLLVALTIGAAAAFLVFRAWRKRRAGKNCGGDCCAAKPREAEKSV
jgi:uncharacterized membrane protein YccC